jgi:hypothetical protein
VCCGHHARLFGSPAAHLKTCPANCSRPDCTTSAIASINHASSLTISAVDIHDDAVAAGLGFSQLEASAIKMLLKQPLAGANQDRKSPQPVVIDKIFRHKGLGWQGTLDRLGGVFDAGISVARDQRALHA